MSDWIDDAGRLTRGQYGPKRGEALTVEEVAAEDPRYLRWLAEEVESLSDDDRAVILTALRFAGRRKW